MRLGWRFSLWDVLDEGETADTAFGEEPEYEATSLVPGHPIMRTRPWLTWRSESRGAKLRRTLSSAV